MIGRTNTWGVTRLLILLLVVTLLPFIVLEVYRASSDVRQRRDALTQQTQNQAAEAALVADDFLRFTQRFLASLAGARSIQSLDGTGSDVLLQAVRTQNPSYESVFLLDAGGRQIASTEPAYPGLVPAQWSRLREVLNTGHMSISEAGTLPGTDKSVLVLAYPVTAPDGRDIAVLGITLNVARLSTVIGYPRLTSGSIVLLVQRDGSVIATGSNHEAWTGLTLSGIPPFTGGSASIRSGTSRGMLPDGRPRLVAYEPVVATPWFVLSAIPQAEVDAVLRSSLIRVGEEAALAIVATVLLAWIMLRRLLVPIRMLSEGASAFAAGFLDRRIPLTRRDEFGALADVLNGMALVLQRRLQEQAEHAEALRALNRLQTEFVATASHELRTPVTAIRTYAEALMRPDISDEEIRRECLEGIDHSSQRLAQLARTLLDVSRIDSGGVSVNLKSVKVSETAATTLGQLDPQGQRRVVLLSPDDLPLALADPERLEDVLANLIMNALKFSPDTEPVDVELGWNDSKVTLVVRDRGMGIPVEEQALIFDRFYQVQRGTVRRSGGSGLGLYITRAYVEAMGGSIRVESGPQGGSSFHVTLRAAPDVENQFSERGANGASAVSASGRR